MIRQLITSLSILLLPILTFGQNVDSLMSFGQNVDSLINVAEELKGKSQVVAFEELAQLFYDQDYAIKAKEYFSKSLEISKEIRDTVGQMNALKGLLRTAYHKEDSIELSMEYAGRLEDISVDYDSKMMQAYVLHHYGRANKEDFNLSLGRLKRALLMYEEAGKKSSAAILYREIGEAILDSFPNDAFQYFSKNLKLVEEVGNEQDIFLARSNISTALISMKQYEDARRFSVKNIELAEESGDQDFLAYNNMLIAISYKNEGNIAKAIEYAKVSQEISEANNLMDKKQYTYQLLKEIYNEKGNITEAFQYFTKEKQIEAELERKKNANKLALQKAQFEIDKRNKEIESINNINYYKNLAKNALIILMCIVGVILYMFNVRRRLKVQLQKEEIEKLKVEQMLEQEERERLKERLEYKERELASNTMFMLQKNKMLTDLKEKIGTLKVTNDEHLRKQVKSLVIAGLTSDI